MTNRTLINTKFHSFLENDGADQGMANLFSMAGGQETSPDLADVIIFNGGADMGTILYGEHPIGPGIPEQPSRRDRMEMDLYYRFKGGNKLLLGICKGAQMLNVLNGGTLWQDVNNHGRSHNMTVLASGQTIYVTSTHHQMMRPGKLGKVLATADCATKKYADPDTWNANGGVFYPDDHKDTEIVWYKDSGSLCIQGHPEYVPNSEFATFCLDMVVHYLDEVRVEA